MCFAFTCQEHFTLALASQQAIVSIPVMMLYICTKFRENTFKVSELLSRHSLHAEI